MCLLAVSVGVTPAGAQRNGQWWWEGRVGLGQRHTENLVDSDRVSEFDLQELRLALAVNGFLGDPTIGRFRLGVDSAITEQEGGRVLDSDSTGLDLSVDLLPKGAYPTHLFYRRQDFDYTFTPPSGPLAPGGFPGTSTQWGGRVQARRGALAGLQLGLNRLDYDLLDRDSRDQTEDRTWLEWADSTQRWQQRLRLERREFDYGFVDLAIDDLTLEIHERFVEERWHWQLTGYGIERDLASGGRELSTEDLRLRNRLTFFVREQDRLDVRAEWGAQNTAARASIDDLGLSVSYRWRPRPDWEVAPFGQYATQSTEETTFTTPRVGVSATWNRAVGHWESLLTGRVSYGETRRRREGEEAAESEAGFGLTLSLGHGAPEAWRKDFELELARNDLSLARGPLVDLPDLGLAVEQLGTNDLYRSRLTLRRQWGRQRVDVWGQWDRRESTGELRLGDTTSDTLTVSAHISGRGFSLQGNLGETDFERPPRPSERVDFHGLLLTLRPRRSLSLRFGYRADDRDLTITPDVETEWLEAGLQYRIGEITIEARAFRIDQLIASQPGRVNRGFRWTLSRGLRGLLPIVTGTQRRGEIR